MCPLLLLFIRSPHSNRNTRSETKILATLKRQIHSDEMTFLVATEFASSLELKHFPTEQKAVHEIVRYVLLNHSKNSELRHTLYLSSGKL